MNVFRIDNKAYDQGYSCGLTGGYTADCPYPKGREAQVSDTRSTSWISGFIDGKAEMEAAKREGRPVRLPQARPMPN